MPRNDVPTVQVDDAEIIFPNFGGKIDKYNPKGDKSFCVVLDPENARIMENDEWNIKWSEPREEGDSPRPYIQVFIRYDKFPPKITLISSAGETVLNDTTVAVMDYTTIDNVDLIFRAYDWEVGDKTGRKAMLKTMYVTVEEDELEKRYARRKAASQDD